MAVECIHGFEVGLCDSCYPKPAPEPKPRVASGRVAGAPRRTAGQTRTRTVVDITGNRAYHVTHVNNLESVLTVGSLAADVRPTVDISSATTRELRRTVQASPGVRVSEFVPFFLTPDATDWRELIAGAAGVHWSDEARAAVPADFIVLVTTLGSVVETAVVADGDAAGSLTRFAPLSTASTEAGERMLRRLLEDEASLVAAELLVPGSVPLEAITLIGVANDKMRAAVKSMLGDVAVAPKVSVYPPWFLAE